MLNQQGTLFFSFYKKKRKTKEKKQRNNFFKKEMERLFVLLVKQWRHCLSFSFYKWTQVYCVKTPIGLFVS